MDTLQERVDQQLLNACSAGEYNSVLRLIDAGANPIQDDGRPLQNAVLHSRYEIVCLLLMMSAHGYCETTSKPFIQQAYKMAKLRHHITKDHVLTNIIKTFEEHYTNVFNETIE